MIPSYSSIYNLGHKAIEDLLKSTVIIEEKIDGSQFSFGVGTDGVLRCRSKGAEINMLAPEKMFAAGVEYVQSIQGKLPVGVTCRCEYLAKPKHNILAYDRVPTNHLMLFDVQRDGENFITARVDKVFAAENMGIELVPELYHGMLGDFGQLREYLDRESVLGGQKIEGVVIKPAAYDLFGRDKKLLIGKFVSEDFKEVHPSEWKKEHKTPGNSEIIALLAGQFATPARWAKALIHLRERGATEGSMRDIPALMAEVPRDVLKECEAEVRAQLFDWAWPQLRRSLTRGLPEWYKEQLAKSAFEQAA